MSERAIILEVRLTSEQWSRLWLLAGQFEMARAMDGDDSRVTPADLIRDIADAQIELLAVSTARAPVLARIDDLIDGGRLTHREIAEAIGCTPSLVTRVARYRTKMARATR